MYPSLSTVLAIVQNTIFTFTLNGKELEKYLLVTIINEKILACFITGEGSYVVYLINLFIFKCN